MKIIKNMKTRMSFKEAVNATPDVKGYYCEGVSALGQYKNKIKVPNEMKLEGSLDIDTSTVKLYPNDCRWDYAICYDGEVFYIEVHSAKTDEVERMINKLRWIQSWLINKAPEINKLTTKTKEPYYWIQSSNFNIPSHTRQYKMIIQNKILPMPIWDYNKLNNKTR